MKDESSSRSSSFDKLRNAHVSEDLIVVVVAKKVCLHGENGLHAVRDDRECDHRQSRLDSFSALGDDGVSSILGVGRDRRSRWTTTGSHTDEISSDVAEDSAASTRRDGDHSGRTLAA